MRYIQTAKQRCKQIQWYITQRILNKGANKYNEIYTKAQTDGANKYNEIYTKAKQRYQTNTMRYIQRLNIGANKYNEIYTKAKQRYKQIQWDIYISTKHKVQTNINEIYTKAKQWCKQIQWDIYKG